jgi:predicted DNA-binding protein YlxM (UPF0122 family)
MGATHGKPARDLALAEQDAKIIKLKRQDLTFQEIADQLGISRAAAQRGFHRGVPRITEPAALEYRAEHLARLELLREVVMGILGTRHVSISNGEVVREVIDVDADGNPVHGEAYEDDGAILSAAATLLKIDEREAKLLGLDSAKKIDMSGTITYELVGIDPADLV